MPIVSVIPGLNKYGWLLYVIFLEDKRGWESLWMLFPRLILKVLKLKILLMKLPWLVLNPEFDVAQRWTWFETPKTCTRVAQ